MDLLVHLFVFVSSCFLVGYCCKLFGWLFLLVVESACKWTEPVLGSTMSHFLFFTRELTSLKRFNPFFTSYEDDGTRICWSESTGGGGQGRAAHASQMLPTVVLGCIVQCNLECCPPWSPTWSVGIKLPTGITARCR